MWNGPQFTRNNGAITRGWSWLMQRIARTLEVSGVYNAQPADDMVNGELVMLNVEADLTSYHDRVVPALNASGFGYVGAMLQTADQAGGYGHCQRENLGLVWLDGSNPTVSVGDVICVSDTPGRGRVFSPVEAPRKRVGTVHTVPTGYDAVTNPFVLVHLRHCCPTA